MNADFAQKCRAWPLSTEEKQPEKRQKRPFLYAWGRQTSEKPRGWPLFSAKSLSVEQFLCTKLLRCYSLFLFNYYKKENKPYKKGQMALGFFRWSIFAPTFFSATFRKPRGCYSIKIKHLTPKHPFFEALHFCFPPPSKISQPGVSA